MYAVRKVVYRRARRSLVIRIVQLDTRFHQGHMVEKCYPAVLRSSLKYTLTTSNRFMIYVHASQLYSGVCLIT